MNQFDNKNFLEQFKKYEKKSKIRMLIAVLVSLILGVLTLYYAAKMKESEEMAMAAEATATKLKADYAQSRDDLIEITDSLNYLLRRCEQEGSKYAKQINSVVSKSEKTSYLIYMHDRTSSGRETSSSIRSQLEKAGYNVAGIEKMGKDFQSSIRYFHKDDLEAAKEVQRIVENSLAKNNELNKVDLTSLFHLQAPRKQLEIWIKI